MQNNLSKIIGLTGSSGSGKSTVARMLSEMGAHVIDVDKAGHRVIAPGGAAFAEVVAAFGTAERKELGAIVFADEAKRRLLEGIVHPLMVREVAEEARKVQGLCVIDAALLFEMGLDGVCDEVWLVKADAGVMLERIVARDGVGKEAAEARLRSLREKDVGVAQVVIVNNGSLGELRGVVEAAVRNLPYFATCDILRLGQK